MNPPPINIAARVPLPSTDCSPSRFANQRHLRAILRGSVSLLTTTCTCSRQTSPIRNCQLRVNVGMENAQEILGAWRGEVYEDGVLCESASMTR